MYTNFPLSEHHVALLAALPGRSPSISSQGEEDVSPNQQGAPPPFPEPHSINRGKEAASASQPQNQDPSIFFETFSNVCQQQLEQQQHNQRLYGLIERITEKLDLVSEQSISARDLLEARLQAPRPTEDENHTAPGGQAQGSLNNGSNNDDDDDDDFAVLYVDHTFYRHKIGEGFIQRQPSELAPAKPAYFNIDDQVTRSLNDTKTSARRAEYTVTVANAFYASIAHEAQKDAVEALEAGDVKNALCLLKQVSNNLGATRDMLTDRMLFLNINADPGATSKQKSFANDILRNEFTPGVEDRGGSSKTHKYFKLYEEQCLKAMLGASAKAQANRHLAAGSYGNGGGAGSSSSSSSANTKKSGTRKGSQPQSAPRDKAAGQQPKPALKAEGSYLKNKEKPQGKKTHFDPEAYESE